MGRRGGLLDGGSLRRVRDPPGVCVPLDALSQDKARIRYPAKARGLPHDRLTTQAWVRILSASIGTCRASPHLAPPNHLMRRTRLAFVAAACFVLPSAPSEVAGQTQPRILDVSVIRVPFQPEADSALADRLTATVRDSVDASLGQRISHHVFVQYSELPSNARLEIRLVSSVDDAILLKRTRELAPLASEPDELAVRILSEIRAALAELDPGVKPEDSPRLESATVKEIR